jgi:hypothetical protein
MKTFRIINLNIIPKSPVSLNWAVQYTSQVGQTCWHFVLIASRSFIAWYSFIEFDCFTLEMNTVGFSEMSSVIYQLTPYNIHEDLGIVTFVNVTVWSVNELRNSETTIHFAPHW